MAGGEEGKVGILSDEYEGHGLVRNRTNGIRCQQLVRIEFPSVNEKQGPAACQVTGGECKDTLTSIGRPVCVFVIFLIQELEQNKDSQKQGCRCR